MNITEYLVIKRIVVVSYPLDTGYKLKAKKKVQKTFRHYVKKVRIRSFASYLSVFSPNAGKYGLDKLRIQILFTQ